MKTHRDDSQKEREEETEEETAPTFLDTEVVIHKTSGSDEFAQEHNEKNPHYFLETVNTARLQHNKKDIKK